MKLRSIDGQRFGKLVVLSHIGFDKNRHSIWKCKCDCGNIIQINKSSLTSGNTSSCGCLWDENNRDDFGQSSWRKLFYTYKMNAERRGLSFDISMDEFVRICSLNCFYCGVPPHKKFQFHGGYGYALYNGIDRLDNSNGYEANNIVPCCSVCNHAKHTMRYEDFKSWIFLVSDNLISKNILQESYHIGD